MRSVLLLVVVVTLIQMMAGSSFSSTRISGCVRVISAGVPSAVGCYVSQPASIIPEKFSDVCRKARWDSAAMWTQLTNGEHSWFLKEDTGGFIYYNAGDGKWWLDGDDGLGLYIAPANDLSPGLPPITGWKELKEAYLPLPAISIEKDAEL